MKLNNGYDDIPISDRVLSTLPYLLPIADGINYGRFLAFYFPQVAAPVYALLNPFLAIYKSSPFASLGIYLALIYIGRSNAVSRFGKIPVSHMAGSVSCVSLTHGVAPYDCSKCGSTFSRASS